MAHELLGQLSSRNTPFAENPVSVQQFGELIDLVQERTMTGTSAKYLLRHLLSHPTGKSSKELANELQLLAFASPAPHTPESNGSSATQPSELDTLIQKAIEAMPGEVAAYKAGRRGVLNKVVGWIMKQSRGRVDAQEVKIQLEKVLNN
jgi:aspartyl-tRNA(Asn)/glutamyl-tRNA(Gln) amidotransferase subunit B